jgi:hypothetical protein
MYSAGLDKLHVIPNKKGMNRRMYLEKYKQFIQFNGDKIDHWSGYALG